MIAPGDHLGGALDTGNRFLVGVKGHYICILNPPTTMPITRLEALNLAGWLVSLADPVGKDFDRIISAIRNT